MRRRRPSLGDLDGFLARIHADVEAVRSDLVDVVAWLQGHHRRGDVSLHAQVQGRDGDRIALGVILIVPADQPGLEARLYEDAGRALRALGHSVRGPGVPDGHFVVQPSEKATAHRRMRGYERVRALLAQGPDAAG